MVRFLKSAWENFKKDFEVYSAYISGTLAFLIGIFGGSIEFTVALTSGTLVLIAVALLKNRNDAEKTQATLEKLARTSSTSEKVIIPESHVLHITEIVSGANKNVAMMFRAGSTLGAMIHLIEAALKRGCTVRIIVCDSDDATLQLLAFRGEHNLKTDDIRGAVQQSHSRLLMLINRFSDNAPLQARAIPYVPSIGITLSDVDSPNGQAFGQIASFRSPAHESPAIKLNRMDDEAMFQFLVTEFENYWNASKPLSPQD